MADHMTRPAEHRETVVLQSVRDLVSNERAQLVVIAVGLPVSSASYGVQIFAVFALVVVVVATSAGARSVWRARPTRSP